MDEIDAALTRVVEKLENDGRGLNLTIEVRDGILKHSKGEKGELLRKRPKSRALTRTRLAGERATRPARPRDSHDPICAA